MPVALTSRERASLKGRAHALEPIVQVGHAGVTDAVVAETDRALTAHELIKPIPFLTEHLDTLAELALHAPKLFIFDLVYAEAVTLSLTNKDLSL